jgi:hypothetical protein
MRKDTPIRTTTTITDRTSRRSTSHAAAGTPIDVATSRGADADVDRASSTWPFDPAGVPPLTWWRTMPADKLGEAEQRILRATFRKIRVLTGREWLAAMHGDAAASVGIAVAMMPIGTMTLEVDLAMSVLMSNALAGNAAAALVLSHLLRHAPLDHPFGPELSVSWLVLNLWRASKPQLPCDPAPTAEVAS